MKVHTSLNYIHFTFSTADKKNDPDLLNKIKLFFLKKKEKEIWSTLESYPEVNWPPLFCLKH